MSYQKYLSLLIRLFVMLILTSFVIYALIKLSPLDPIKMNYGNTSSLLFDEDKINALESLWGTDENIFFGYANWIVNALHLDFGYSPKYNQNVIDVIYERGLSTFFLLFISWILSGLFGYSLGLIAALNKGKMIDKIIKCVAYALASTPIFWFAMLLIEIFAINLGILPAAFASNLSNNINSPVDLFIHSILPIATLSLAGISKVCMHTREKSIEILKKDYIDYAKKCGENKMTIFKKHLLKNSISPFVSIQTAEIAELIGGSILIEQVFSYPGLGKAIIDAASGGDSNLLMAIGILSTSLVCIAYFISKIIIQKLHVEIKKD